MRQSVHLQLQMEKYVACTQPVIIREAGMLSATCMQDSEAPEEGPAGGLPHSSELPEGVDVAPSTEVTAH